MFDAVPVSVLMLLALMVPVVLALREFRTAASSDVSLSVIVSSPRLLMPEEP